MSILNLATTAVTPVRSTVGEVTRFHFNGGTAPQFNIETTEPFVANAQYTFAGTVESIDTGYVFGAPLGGDPSDHITAAGAFSLPVVAAAGAGGSTTFSMRGSFGCVAVLRDISLVPVV